MRNEGTDPPLHSRLDSWDSHPTCAGVLILFVLIPTPQLLPSQSSTVFLFLSETHRGSKPKLPNYVRSNEIHSAKFLISAIFILPSHFGFL